ncbi:hypothetical protein [Hyalangium gracile]|uniref:hypothetical protein n=1 Tax=Hyalangium gracile TaxID=394092 RepID=UPI001CCA70C5|nr:hypothetical protein [Hyalangium gracile]
MKLAPPGVPSPQPGESILGTPLDPQLAAIYRRLGAAEFWDLALHGLTSDEDGLIPRNEWLRRRGQVQYRASLVFGWKPGFAFYYGTVPQLANSRGIQPVIYIQAMEALFAVPIASSVDRFFQLYSHYLERLVRNPGYVGSGIPDVTFPWDMADLIGQDAALMRQLHAGRFDFLTDNQRDALEWLQELRALHP